MLQRRILSLILTLVFSLALLPVSAFAENTVDWAGSYNKPGNNSIASGTLPDGEIKQDWKTEDVVGNGTVVIVGDYIYTYDGADITSGQTNASGKLHKIEKDTGTVIQSRIVSNAGTGYYYSYMAYGNDMLYVACTEKVLAFKLSNLQLLWQVTVPKKNYCPIQYVNGFVVTNGIVLNAENGELMATLPGVYSYASGAEYNGVFYVADVNGFLYAVDTFKWEEVDKLQFSEDTFSRQAGVACADGKLFWSSGTNLYSVELNTNGEIIDDTMTSVSCGISSVCTPVVVNDRVYLAGKVNSSSDEGCGVVGVFQTSDLSKVYIAGGANTNIQSTPIACVGTDGNTYVYVQDYGLAEEAGWNLETSSSLYVLKDNANKTYGRMIKLAETDPANFAYEQLACDTDGALYCTNDSGYLVRYVSNGVAIQEDASSLGDVDCDGDVDDKDVTILKRYLAKWSGVSISALAADADKSGVIDEKDVTYLKRVLVKWPGYTLN